MIRVEHEENRIELVDPDELIKSLTYENEEQTILHEYYRDFKIVVRGRMYDIYPEKVVNFYTGYVKYVGKYDSFRIYQILRSEEILKLIHYDWTGFYEEYPMGIDCEHDGDISLHPNLHNIYVFEGEENATFKSPDYVFDNLEKVIDKVHNIVEKENNIRAFKFVGIILSTVLVFGLIIFNSHVD